MAFGEAVHGINGLIYVGGTEIYGGNAWQINIATESAEYVKFGDSWKNREVGVNDWSGNIQAWHDQDEKTLQDAATGGVAIALLIYPKRGDLATFYSGDAIFGAGSSGNTTSVIALTGDFVGAGILTPTGFTA